ncbi:hypothetical protein [Arthrobacter sp. ISL-72]|uniref:hypothetical protein n=1 Tax=Arthrobacter sp. ISL-72 TaxID=2819114 RepID=UPI001BED1F25|nr:hypothetical protein [Arthrobacter sp. ISL-72]MBT2594070.1 hypothetical protein [Arthrobacter sp. ISL-72]
MTSDNAKRLRWLVLIISALSIPFLVVVEGVRASSPSLDHTDSGWATVALPFEDLRTARDVKIRLVYDPAYALSSDPNARVVDGRDSTTRLLAEGDQLAKNAGHIGAGYAVLICAIGSNKVKSIHASLFLEGNARLSVPFAVTYQGGMPLMREADSTSLSGGTPVMHWNDIQAFDFTISEPPLCDGPRTLKPGRTLLDRGGDDTKSGFVVTGIGNSDLPKFVESSFLGIPGPQRTLKTPMIGGLPTGRSGVGPDTMSFANFHIDSQDSLQTMVMDTLPTEITARSFPENLRFRESSPSSEESQYPDLSSVATLSAQISAVDGHSATIWDRLSTAALIYFTIGSAILASAIFLRFWPTSTTGDQLSGQRVKGHALDSRSKPATPSASRTGRTGGTKQLKNSQKSPAGIPHGLGQARPAKARPVKKAGSTQPSASEAPDAVQRSHKRPPPSKAKPMKASPEPKQAEN